VLDADGTSVVWVDDANSERVVDLARVRGNRLITVGEHGDTLRLAMRVPTLLGQKLTIVVGDRAWQVTLPLIGAYQAANALTAAGLVIATGGDVGQTLMNLARLQPVRGRLERAAITKTGAPVYVDYAHTPDALEAAGAALKPHAEGRLILVFGAGGDRDPGKREPMGNAAAYWGDVRIVTDDNPRTEDPATIRAAILKGCLGAIEIPDRREAIRAAIEMAEAGDIVLIAGKGHEQGQIVGDMVLPFDDVAVARECAA
jgi:UDP-N-acetylmuramoyl-L-alanyl-D-glutamate--2,6-diaminopimelate ligase